LLFPLVSWILSQRPSADLEIQERSPRKRRGYKNARDNNNKTVTRDSHREKKALEKV
jgi:hypothetical protein